MMSGPLCLLILVTAVPVARAGECPNLLIITADDLNADSAGWMGSKAGATPNLDAFAATGVRFVGCHVTAPICQPSRSALMTGRVPHRSGALGFDPIRPDVPTLVEVLKGRGYFTAVLNKAGHLRPAQKFPWDRATDGSGKAPAILRTEFESALREAAGRGQPFFINANITDPHRPFPDREIEPGTAPVPSFLEDLPGVREEIARYLTAVARMDRSFGLLIESLRASGREADTVVVVLSDHGMSFPFAKATVYRNGTWSPVIVRAPGRGMTPITRTDLVSSVDVMPTVLDLLDIEPPPGMDGRSLVPLMRGETQAGRDHVVTHVNTVSSGASFPQRCVRTRDRSLIFAPWSDGHARFRAEAMTGLSYRAMADAARSDQRIRSRVEQLVTGTPLALYDIESDPDERDNRIDDPRYRADVGRLASLLMAHMERTGDPQLETLRRAIAARSKPWRAWAWMSGGAAGAVVLAVVRRRRGSVKLSRREADWQ